ncbi:MAG TPA: hypothetical protein VLH09_11145 [Bryobacteraceae bacterium]|nr:hypothetical protein [Bryobacteraceae bacterium]
MRLLSITIGLAATMCFAQTGWEDGYSRPLPIPHLQQPPVIDGDLAEWKYLAFSDGVWDLFRVMRSPWYDPSINRLTDHGNESPIEDDLAARYYIAWDDKYLYLGAEVRDNVHDVEDPKPAPERWMFKDAICWFIEAPRRATGKKFGRGNSAFCFLADVTKPPHGAWWRHGSPEKTYIEEPLPAKAVDYSVRLDPWKTGRGDFILEARVEMAPTFGVSDPDWRPPKIGDEYGLEIVHNDPDGGSYGAHLLIYGKADDDATWGRARLVGPVEPPVRKPR